MTVAEIKQLALDFSGSEEEQSELPEGWVPTTIGTVAELNPAKLPQNMLPSEASVTFVPMSAVDAESGIIAEPKERCYGEVRKGYTSFQEGDVIFAKITPCMENGKAAIARGLINGVGFGSTEFHVLRSTGAFIPEYLFYYVRQELFRRAAESEMTGSVGQRRVPVEFLENTPLPLPPLAEQKRIAAKVEALLARVNAAWGRLERVPVLLKRFRQAVLAAACSGRLTEEWREQHPTGSSAHKYLEKVLKERRVYFEKTGAHNYKEPVEPDSSQLFDVPDQWAVASMDQLTCLVTSGPRGWAKFYADSGPVFIRAQNINTDKLRLEDIARVQPPNNAEGLRPRVRLGDLLITITGANVTKAALVDVDLDEAYISQHVALTRLVDPAVVSFVFLWTISPLHGRAKLLADAYGAGKPGLNLDNIKEMVVPLPPLSEQREIVRRVEALFALADVVEKRVEAAQARAERLTQAILAKAFRGELVPTEAELARREGRSYEPAGVLLAKIRAKRERAKSQKRGSHSSK